MSVLEFNPEQPETIVLLHAGNVAGWMWGEQVPAFADYHLLVPDLPGFGGSNHLPWVSLAAAAADVATLVAARAHGGRAHVVGLSLGASVALELAAGVPGILAATAPGMRHQWNIENVELFNAALRTWLDERAVHPGLIPAG